VIRRRFLGFVILLAACACESATAAECTGALADHDVQAIRAVIEAYRTAWLRGDEKGVLATFTSDAVLLPAHGAPRVAGTPAITNYWWPPEAPATTITKLDITVEAVEGNCGVASLIGRRGSRQIKTDTRDRYFTAANGGTPSCQNRKDCSSASSVSACDFVEPIPCPAS
jgi:ketosteroid isomerase-like protein